MKTNRIIASLILTVSLMVQVTFGQTSWDNFDTPGKVNYPFFNGTIFNQSHTNPITTGNNTSATCAQYARNGGVLFDVILLEPLGTLKVGNVADFRTGTKTMTIKVYSPAVGKTVQITLEDKNTALPTNFPIGRHSEYTATTTVANSWETLTFALVNRPDTNVSDTSINRMVILFDPNSNNSDTYLFDDIMGPGLVDPCSSIPTDTLIGEDYECQRNVSWDFANGTHIQDEVNPVASGINTSSKCGKFIKFLPPTNDGAFGGTLNHTFSSVNLNTAHIELYSPSGSSDFKMVFQDASGNDIIDSLFVTTSTSSWQKFDMDLSSVPAGTSISKFVFLLNSPTATADSIFIDNFSFSFNNSVGINENDDAKTITLYPNPFTNQLTINSNSVLKNITVYDLSGKTILTRTNINVSNTSLDLSNLVQGSYLIKVEESNGVISTQKIIKATN